jgi:nicotinate-nucleotide adenylyltransferase
MKVGILGGTFDPIHLGHLILAEAAREQLGLNRVLFIPAGDPWRKAGREIAPAGDRLAMVRLAVAGNPHFEVETCEVEREGPSYTLDTLHLLRTRDADAAFYLILGADAYADLPHWHEPALIAREAVLAVAGRPDVAEAQSIPDAQVVGIDMPAIDISATDLRRRARGGLSLRYLVPGPVEAYIFDHALYRG